MKKVLTLLLAGAICFTLAGCGGANDKDPADETVTVTENTDPVTLASEKLDRTAWTGAFTDADNYGMKSVVTVESTENGQTMSEVITFIYKFDGEKVALNMTMAENGTAAFEGEAYLEISGENVTVWQRNKENEGWTDWDSEQFSMEELGSVFGLTDGLTFVKDEYANFSYSDADKGYLATASGLTEMKEPLDAFLEGVLSPAGDASGFEIAKFIVKANGGKPSACIAEMTAKAPAPDARDMLPIGGGANPKDTASPDDTTSPDDTASPDGNAPGQDEGNGDTPAPETPATQNIKVTQVYFDYGKVTVEKPEGISADTKPSAVQVIPR